MLGGLPRVILEEKQRMNPEVPLLAHVVTWFQSKSELPLTTSAVNQGPWMNMLAGAVIRTGCQLSICRFGYADKRLLSIIETTVLPNWNPPEIVWRGTSAQCLHPQTVDELDYER